MARNRPIRRLVWAFKEVEVEAFGFTPVFINSWLVLCSAVCQCSPGPAGIACVPFPPVGVAAVGSWLKRPIPAYSPSSAGVAGGGSERSSSSVQNRLLSPLCHKHPGGASLVSCAETRAEHQVFCLTHALLSFGRKGMHWAP